MNNLALSPPKTVALAFVALLTACATNFSEESQQRLRATQTQPAAVSFESTQTFPGEVLCGVYTTLSNDGFRMITGDFVVTPDRAMPAPSELETLIFCSRRSEDLLFSRLGIGGDDDTWANIATIHADMVAIDDAITRYFNTRHIMPSTLASLHDSGFLTGVESSVDPWGNAYVYEEELTGRSTPKYGLSSYGRDAAPGGTGPDADISDDNLLFVRHVLRVKGLIAP